MTAGRHGGAGEHGDRRLAEGGGLRGDPSTFAPPLQNLFLASPQRHPVHFLTNKDRRSRTLTCDTVCLYRRFSLYEAHWYFAVKWGHRALKFEVVQWMNEWMSGFHLFQGSFSVNSRKGCDVVKVFPRGVETFAHAALSRHWRPSRCIITAWTWSNALSCFFAISWLDSCVAKRLTFCQPVTVNTLKS